MSDRGIFDLIFNLASIGCSDLITDAAPTIWAVVIQTNKFRGRRCLERAALSALHRGRQVCEHRSATPCSNGLEQKNYENLTDSLRRRAVVWLSPLNVGNQPEAVSPSMAPKGGYRPTTDGRDWHGGDQTLHRFR